MTTKRPFRLAINGFGRIGRSLLRVALADKDCPFEVVAINDLTDAKTLAHLFKYDSIHRTWPGKVAVVEGGIAFGDVTVRHVLEKDPLKLPWKELEVDLVLESTGKFTDREKAELHLQGGTGAKKVLVSAPAKKADVTCVYGINHDTIKPEHTIISAASCTTTCLAPVAKVLHELAGIKHGTMTTIHSFTNDQVTLDGPHKDLRRARAASMNMVPTSTGAAKAIGLVVPELDKKLSGVAIRVPTPDVSVCDVVCVVERPVTADEVNAAMKAAAEGPLYGAMRYNEDMIVSSDLIGETFGSVFDSTMTTVQDGTLVKIVSWYDNEWGYTNRMYQLICFLARM
jgi:glyceraldehyde 3-phosphate dehydrogenase